FKEVVEHVSASMREAHKWQEFFSLEQSFPIAFEYYDVPQPVVAGKTRFVFVKQASCADRFKIKLSCAKSAGQLVLSFVYDASLFHAEDIERLSDQFRTLVQSMLQNPGGPAGGFDIVSGLEHERLLTDFSTTASTKPRNTTIHQ